MEKSNTQRSVFIGEHSYNIDEKKRLALPARFRDDLGRRVVLTRGLDQCLFVYPWVVWQDIAAKLGSLPFGEHGTRSFVRLMLSGAADVDVDAQGRIVIPEHLRAFAALTRAVVVAGVFNRLEIWDEHKWRDYRAEAEKNSEEIAEQLGKIGVY